MMVAIIFLIIIIGFNLMLSVEYGGNDNYLGKDGYLNYRGRKIVLINFIITLITISLVNLFFLKQG